MRDVPAQRLSELGELLAAISLRHLDPDTRRKLAEGSLSVNAYPHDTGGLVYVGSPAYAVPTEPDLAGIFALAASAHIVWLMFDAEAAIVEGLPVHDEGHDEESAS